MAESDWHDVSKHALIGFTRVVAVTHATFVVTIMRNTFTHGTALISTSTHLVGMCAAPHAVCVHPRFKTYSPLRSMGIGRTHRAVVCAADGLGGGIEQVWGEWGGLGVYTVWVELVWNVAS